MLFKNYPKQTYRLNETDVLLVDIFKNVSFNNVQDSYAFNDYYIQEGDSPESVATKLYGTPNLSWLVLLPNKVVNIKDDWFVSRGEHEQKRETQYGGDAFYISALPDIRSGDLIVKVTGTGGETATAVNTSVYRQVAEFDPYFRKIRGICGSGTINSGDNILIARQNKETGIVETIKFTSKDYVPKEVNYTDVLYTEKYVDSILYLATDSNVVIDPYRYGVTGASAAASDAVFSHPYGITTENNFAYTLLYKYGACGGVLSNLNKQTIGGDNYSKYIAKQKIRVLRPEYVKIVVSTITNQLESSAVFKAITITV